VLNSTLKWWGSRASTYRFAENGTNGKRLEL
jgi:hypothetical protein